MVNIVCVRIFLRKKQNENLTWSEIDHIYHGLSKLPLEVSAVEAHNLNIAHNWEGEGVHWSAIEIDFRQALKKNVFRNNS